MANARITVEGDADVAQALEQLPAAVRREALRGAVDSAARIVESAVRANAHFGEYSTGALAESIGIRSTQIAGEPSAVVKSLGRPAKRAHLVEGPTRPHGGHPGTEAQPFIGPGYESSQETALDRMEQVIGDAIEAQWGRE